MPQKKCSKCNAPFQCGCDTTGCWCEQLFVKPETLNYLKQTFDNCLCASCLEQYSVNTEKNNQES